MQNRNPRRDGDRDIPLLSKAIDIHHNLRYKLRARVHRSKTHASIIGTTISDKDAMLFGQQVLPVDDIAKTYSNFVSTLSDPQVCDLLIGFKQEANKFTNNVSDMFSDMDGDVTKALNINSGTQYQVLYDNFKKLLHPSKHYVQKGKLKLNAKSALVDVMILIIEASMKPLDRDETKYETDEEVVSFFVYWINKRLFTRNQGGNAYNIIGKERLTALLVGAIHPTNVSDLVDKGASKTELVKCIVKSVTFGALSSMCADKTEIFLSRLDLKKSFNLEKKLKKYETDIQESVRQGIITPEVGVHLVTTNKNMHSQLLDHISGLWGDSMKNYNSYIFGGDKKSVAEVAALFGTLTPGGVKRKDVLLQLARQLDLTDAKRMADAQREILDCVYHNVRTCDKRLDYIEDSLKDENLSEEQRPIATTLIQRYNDCMGRHDDQADALRNIINDMKAKEYHLEMAKIFKDVCDAVASGTVMVNEDSDDNDDDQIAFSSLVPGTEGSLSKQCPQLSNALNEVMMNVDKIDGQFLTEKDIENAKYPEMPQLYGVQPNSKLENWNIYRKLGSGAFGVVLAAQHKQELDCHVAIKILPDGWRNHDGFFTRELLASCAAPQDCVYVAQTLAWGELRRSLFEECAPDKRCFYIIMELCKHNLQEEFKKNHYNYMHNKKYVKEWTVVHFIKQLRHILKVMHDICSALAVLLDLSIIHRDIKADNVLLGFDGKYKITDWGLARDVYSDAFNDEESPVTVGIGTPDYMAPEMQRLANLIQAPASLLSYADSVTPSCDMFSAGVIFYLFVYGSFLYSHDRKIITKEITDKKFCVDDKNHKFDFNPELKDIIKQSSDLCYQMLRYNPKDRIKPDVAIMVINSLREQLYNLIGGEEGSEESKAFYQNLDASGNDKALP